MNQITEKIIQIICDENKPFKNILLQGCVEFCEIKDILEKNCFLEFKNKNSQDILLDNVEIGFTSGKYNTSNLDNGNDEIIKNDKVTITLTTSENQNKNDNNNVTTI